MPVIHPSDAVVYEIHGSTFTSYAAPRSGSAELCAWRVDVPAGVTGVAHRVTREEILHITAGSATVTLDDEKQDVTVGDVIIVPAGSLFGIDTGAEALSAWVNTSVGLRAALADGSWLTPPWTV
ncbi:cupin [Longispora fulva]|uniref:Quercetin dioxygenase-like cupin family protein n=1 Tax=Longispora fulva TaxID=619741 RepID=A0A8J7GLW2_9ACTN|nr:cupin domain-containing protein [Longispora fulva]MBG6135434.1 quercetin dioxygenase-like cupin family protein [Longispora fulva]GIG56323.1 cupin [Longispora fulva]